MYTLMYSTELHNGHIQTQHIILSLYMYIVIEYSSLPSQTSPLSDCEMGLEQFSHTVVVLNCQGKNLCPLLTYYVHRNGINHHML